MDIERFKSHISNQDYRSANSLIHENLQALMAAGQDKRENYEEFHELTKLFRAAFLAKNNEQCLEQGNKIIRRLGR
jgi:hypothetical protein